VSELRSLPVAGMTWHTVTRLYPTAALAKADWEKVQRIDKARQGRMNVGVYRHGPENHELSGRYLTVVGHEREGVEEAAALLGGADANAAADEWWLVGMVGRRIRVLAELEAAGAKGPGVGLVVRRPEERGAVLRQDGTMDERVGLDA
jgi:hypothetical protein